MTGSQNVANEAQHIQWALHNIDVMNHIAVKDFFCDWTATLAFYTALHVVDGVLYSTTKRHGVCHVRRSSILKMDRRFTKIYQHYSPLYRISRVARYIQPDERKPGYAIPFQAYMNAENVENIAIQHHLKHVMSSAKKFLSVLSAKYLDEGIRHLPRTS